jgi:hypothetical protein
MTTQPMKRERRRPSVTPDLDRLAETVGSVVRAIRRGIEGPTPQWRATDPEVQLDAADLRALLEALRVSTPAPTGRLKDFFVGDAVPPRCLEGARAKLGVPDDELIVALIDTTRWGTGRKGAAFGQRGIYYRNGFWSSVRGTGFVAYASLPVRRLGPRLLRGFMSGVADLGGGQSLDLGHSSLRPKDLSLLLSKLTRALPQVKTVYGEPFGSSA